MLNKLVLVSLLSLSACVTATDADIEERPQPPIAGCTQAGPILFGVDRQVRVGPDVMPEVARRQPTSTFALHRTGGWTFVEKSGDGRILREGSGCVPLAQIQQIDAAFAAVPWQTSQQAHCALAYLTFTTYSVNGKRVVDEHVCNDEALDAKSQRALADAKAIVDKLIAGVK